MSVATLAGTSAVGRKLNTMSKSITRPQST